MSDLMSPRIVMLLVWVVLVSPVVASLYVFSPGTVQFFSESNVGFLKICL